MSPLFFFLPNCMVCVNNRVLVFVKFSYFFNHIAHYLTPCTPLLLNLYRFCSPSSPFLYIMIQSKSVGFSFVCVRAVVVYIVSQSCNCFYLQQNQQTIGDLYIYVIPKTNFKILIIL